MLRTLERRTESLEDVIEALSNEFMAFGNRIVESAQVMNQPDVLVDVKKATERFLDIARSVELARNGEEASPSINQTLQVSANEVAGTSSSSPGSLPLSTNGSKHPSASLETPRLFAANSSDGNLGAFAKTTQFNSNNDRNGLDAVTRAHSMATGKFSPRLDYGLFGTWPRQSSPVPAVPWSQYLIAGPNSFAIRLYIDTQDIAWKVLRGGIAISGSVPSVCRYGFRYERPDKFEELIRRQLSLIHSGDYNTNTVFKQSENDHSIVLFGPADYAMWNHIIPQIVKDANQDYGSVNNDWLDPWDTQQYIIAKWGIRLTSTTATIPSQALRAVSTTIPWQREVAEDRLDSNRSTNEVLSLNDIGALGNDWRAIPTLPNFDRESWNYSIYEPYVHGSIGGDRNLLLSIDSAESESQFNQVHSEPSMSGEGGGGISYFDLGGVP